MRGREIVYTVGQAPLESTQGLPVEGAIRQEPVVWVVWYLLH